MCWSASAAGWSWSTGWLPNLLCASLFNHLANLNFNFLLFLLTGCNAVLVLFFDLNRLADVDSSLAFFCLTDSDAVLVLFFNWNLLANVDSSLAFFWLANSHVVGVLLFASLSFVASVFNFGFDHVWNPNLAGLLTCWLASAT